MHSTVEKDKKTSYPKTMIDKITITRPDDWHLHLRDGDMLKGIMPETTRHFGRAIIMPNLIPPVITSNEARMYRDRILAARPVGSTFNPLMTLYLTDKTDPNDVSSAFADGLINAVKYYPAGATTNSESGVTDINNVMPVLEKMAEIGLTLCMHGEVTDPEIDIFDREAVFIDKVLNPLRLNLPELKTTSEHITTKDGVDYVKSQSKNHAASITTHHMMINRNHLLVGGIKPHYYCLPVVKREEHRLAIRDAATSGDSRYFLGTDSAPHLDPNKETGCGCAGCFTATNTMPLLAHVFDEDNKLKNLEKFTSFNGPKHYDLEPNQDTITLVKSDTASSFPEKIQTNDGPVTVFDPGHKVYWKVRDS